MNRRGDCVCAIPCLPPERHHPDCPVRRRVERIEETPHLHPRCPVCGHDHPGIGGCITAHAFVLREHCRACRFSAQLSGAGADQAPGEASEARPGAPGERPRHDAGTPEPSHPNPPLDGGEHTGCGGRWKPYAKKYGSAARSVWRCSACGEERGAPEGGA